MGEIKFNKAQKELINTLDGPVLCVACPGSGKTTTMIARILHMLDTGVEPESILPVTFTKAAKSDMTLRFNKMAPEELKNKVTFRTIHGVAFSICMSLGYGINDVMKDYDGLRWAIDILKQPANLKTLQAMSISDGARQLMSEISFVRNCELNPLEFESESVSGNTFVKLFREYEKHKKENGLLDWDDMIIMARDKLRDNEEFRQNWQKLTRYIMVDEFQDVNKIQYDIINFLAGGHRNLCIVGDDDQSIYAFRGAKSALMLDFPNKYPDCKRIDMDYNYRSEPMIVAKAGRLIEHNHNRFKKAFKASHTGEADIKAVNVDNGSAEARYIVTKIKKMLKNGIKPEDIGILYRTGAQSSTISGMFMKEEIPFHTNDKPVDVHEDLAFHDLMAWYRVCTGQATEGDVRSVLIRPSRYFKKDDFSDIKKFDRDKLMERATKLDSGRMKTGKKAYMVRNMQALFNDVDRLKRYTDYPEKFTYMLFERMNYRDDVMEAADIYNHDSDEWDFIFDEIEKESEEQNSFKEWTDYVNEYHDVLIKTFKQGGDGVTLSTFHSAKGLEWEHVFILDCNDDVCPYYKAITPDEKEEERRMFYVAVTRAKKHLELIVNKTRRNKTADTSPYLSEMGVNYINA